LNLPFVRRWGQIVLRQAVSSMFSDLLLDAAYHDETVTPDLIDAYKRPLYTRDWDIALLGMVRDMRNNALPAPASSIQAPTLILWGAQDTWVDPATGVWLDEEIPNSKQITFDQVGHLPMHEVPDDFNTALIEFLDGLK
jgi:pimeloyl-ACP methyl ester carboxylesterase